MKPSALRWRPWILVCVGLQLSCVSCGGGDDEGGPVGSPCDVAEDCQDGLICDVHGGRGSCQELHEHDDEHDEEDHDHPDG